MAPTKLMTINTGSSSLKAALYHVDQSEQLDFAVNAERIGHDGSRLRIQDPHGKVELDRKGDLPDHAAAMRAWFDWLRQAGQDQGLAAVGHRVVHGGSKYREPCVITPDVTAALQALVPIDPEHLPQALGAMAVVGQAYPSIPQIACFDTSFHRSMPRVAQMFALPRAYWEAGVMRLGFHGLSYEYIVQELRALDAGAADGRVVIAHLGNGASMAAVRDGVGVDTTMGFTPTGGLVMGTRAGDLDPGVLLYLLQSRGLSADALGHLVTEEAGLLGISGSSADMHDLIDRESDDSRAAEAVELFCYQARKFLGALVAVLGGLDTLVFTGGIGEHAASVRQRIGTGFEYLGLQIDPERNAAHAPIISRDRSAVVVRVLATDEDLMIARHTNRLLQQGSANRVPI